jgi:hypothetical protein
MEKPIPAGAAPAGARNAERSGAMRKIVLTGAPGSGKTVITARLAAEHPERFALVPEAATQVYAQLNVRWDRLDLAARRDAQRRMYRLQLDQETRLAAAHPHKTLLLDRGTVDGAADWPDGPEPFWSDVGSGLPRELSRYDAVILLDTAAALGLYDGSASNACRFEDAAGAIRVGEALRALWGAHPRFRFVGAYRDLEEKLAQVRALLSDLPRGPAPA